MIFEKTPHDAFSPAQQAVLAAFDEGLTAALESVGITRLPNEALCRLASRMGHNNDVLHEDLLLDFGKLENLEFLAAYLHDQDTLEGYDSVLGSLEYAGGMPIIEMSLDRLHGGVSGLLSRLSLTDSAQRDRIGVSLLRWGRKNLVVMDWNDPGKLVHELHLNISLAFEGLVNETPYSKLDPGLVRAQRRTTFESMFLGVVAPDAYPFSEACYRSSLNSLVDSKRPGDRLNQLIPHLLYDPLFYMLMKGESARDIVTRLKPAFDCLLNTIPCTREQRSILFQQLLYNGLSRYPTRLKEFFLDGYSHRGIHPEFTRGAEISQLTRILSGPMGAFVSSLEMDVPDNKRIAPLQNAHIHGLMDIIDTHLSRTPLVSSLSIGEAPEDIALFDYHLKKGNIHPETIHYQIKHLTQLSGWSAAAAAGIVIGEFDYWEAKAALTPFNLDEAKEFVQMHPGALPMIAAHLEGRCKAGMPEQRALDGAQGLGILSGELLRGFDFGRRARIREGALGGDLGL